MSYPSLSPLRELDAMIGRAQEACARYRRAAAEPGLSHAVTRHRLGKLGTMEEALARLEGLRAPARP